LEITSYDRTIYMEIPARVRILASIQIGSVYYFQEEQVQSTEPHYFVVLNKNPRSEDFLILVCASSQVEKRKQIIQKLGFPPETLVFISPKEFPLFTKETVVDCNRAFEKTAQLLINKLEQGKLGVCTEIMPIEIVRKLVKGILASTQISKNVQKVLTTDDERKAEE
jgi:hypothetical protein